MNLTAAEAVDTNIVVYASDPTDADKQGTAQRLLQTLTERGTLTISVQVPNEFYARITRPNRPPALSHEEATKAVEALIAAAVVLPLTSGATRRALDAVPRYHFHFWDELIWAVAKENGVGIIYTENMPSDDVIEGVRYINPFAPDA